MPVRFVSAGLARTNRPYRMHGFNVASMGQERIALALAVENSLANLEDPGTSAIRAD